MRRALGAQPGRGLLLGATRELFALSSNVVVVDRNMAMLEALDATPSQTLQCDWLSIPSRIGPFDFVLGDGSLNCIRFPDQYISLFHRLAALTRSDALIVLRFFASPSEAEPWESVLNAALEGKIGSFHAFKWRLAMALAGERRDDHYNVVVEAIAERFDEYLPDRVSLSRATGWSVTDINTIDVYRGSPAHYSFPPLSRLLEVIGPLASHRDTAYARYELADRCPILTFASRSG